VKAAGAGTTLEMKGGTIVKRGIIIGLFLAVAMMLGACGGGGLEPVAKVGPLEIYDPWARVALNQGAVYLAIRNTGDADDMLVAASTDVARTELHTTVMHGDQMAMEPVQGIPVRAGSWAALHPGGLHIMLMEMRRELRPGDKVNLELRFEKAGTVSITVPVRALVQGQEGGMSHY
jgi:copper(I)-binding protein